VIGEELMTIDDYSMNFTVSISNINGFIYLGLDFVGKSKPSHA
jgi:hypothetical protein